MKNIQVIDGADNCTYSLFATDDDSFAEVFPDEQDIEFSDDFFARIGEERASAIFAELWKHPVDKQSVRGIHGTLFFGLPQKKKYYPTKRDAEMILGP